MSAKVKWPTSFPEHWDIVPAKRLFPESKIRAAEEDEQLSATQSYGVISQSEFMLLAGRKVVQLNSNQHLRKRVEIGDFVISMRSFQGGLERAWATGGIRSSYVVLKPRSNLDLGYYQYLFKSAEYIQALQSTANFIRDGQDMSYQDFILIDLPLPPCKEQNSIATFLNYEITRIDKLIARQQKLIELLKEKCQAVISHAVTKGLNPDVPMKDSGVEWLDTIPLSWEVKPTYVACSASTEKNTDGLENNVLSLSYGEIIQKNIDTNFGLLPDSFNTYQIIKNGDIILRLTDLQNDKHSLRVGLVTQKGIITSAYLKLRIKNTLISSFLYYLLHAYDIYKVFYGMGGGLRQSMKFEDFRRLPLLIPPKEEQCSIAAFLDEKRIKIDALIEKQLQQIELLKERRTALISAAVTGKIDVRHWRAPDEQTTAEAEVVV